MKRFVLSQAATADIEQIEAFLDEHAPHATDAVLDGLRDAMRRIATTPGIGHLREELTDEPLRFFPVWSRIPGACATRVAWAVQRQESRAR